MWLAVSAQRHPVGATAACVATSLLLLSFVWTGGGSGGEYSSSVDFTLRGSSSEALGSVASAGGASGQEFNHEFKVGGNISVGVCIDVEPDGLTSLPANRTYSHELCVEWAREANCRKSADFMLENCIPECRECQARPRCCLGLHADSDECDESLGVPRWGLEKISLDTRWELFPGVRSIVEVGGNSGFDASMIADRFPEARLFSFEPVPDYYEALLANMGNTSRVTVKNVGLSDRNYTAMFNIDGQSSSDISLKGRKQVKAVLRDVDTVLRELQGDFGSVPDAVTLNCEGCEYAVLRRMAERGWLGRVRFVQLSWHLVLDMHDRVAQRCAIERILRKHYDPVYYTMDFGWQGWRLHGVAGYNTTRTTTRAPEQDYFGYADIGESSEAGETGSADGAPGST